MRVRFNRCFALFALSLSDNLPKIVMGSSTFSNADIVANKLKV